MEIVINEYDTKIDSKNRFTVRGAEYDYYHVIEYDNGHIELVPRILVDPDIISNNTLNIIDKSVENFKNGIVSDPIDFLKYPEDQ